MIAVELDDARWQRFVEEHPEALPFHHPAWTGLLAECYGYRPFALAVTDGSGGIAAGLPLTEISGPLGRRRWVSLPFTDYCPLLSSGGESEARLVTALTEARAAAGIPRLEVRDRLAGPGVHVHPPHLLHRLELAADTQ